MLTPRPPGHPRLVGRDVADVRTATALRVSHSQRGRPLTQGVRWGLDPGNTQQQVQRAPECPLSTANSAPRNLLLVHSLPRFKVPCWGSTEGSESIIAG